MDHREHAVTLDDMTVSTRPDGLLATKGQGHLDAYALSLGGRVGPLDGADLKLNVQSPDVSGWLKDLEAPPETSPETSKEPASR